LLAHAENSELLSNGSSPLAEKPITLRLVASGKADMPGVGLAPVRNAFKD